MAIYRNGKEVELIYYGNKPVIAVYYYTEGELKLVWEEGNFKTADNSTFVTFDGSTFNVYYKDE